MISLEIIYTYTQKFKTLNSEKYYALKKSQELLNVYLLLCNLQSSRMADKN